MAETFERLGIQLELDNQIKGNPTEVLANLKKTLEGIAQVLKGIDLSKLGKGKVGDVSSELKKTKDSAKDATSGLKEVAAAVAKAGEAAKKTAKDIQYVGRDFADFFKTNKEVFKSMADGSDELAKKMASPYYKELKAMRKEMQDTADVSAVVGKRIADNLVSMLNFSPDGKSATKLRSVIEGAIRINSGTADLKQLERSNDIMVQIGNNAFHAKTQTEQLANTIANKLRRGTLEESDIKIFSKEKFDRDVKSVMTQLAGLRDFSEKNGLSVKGIGSLETKALNAKTLSDLDKVRDKIAEIKTATNRDLTFTKLEEQAAKLRRAYEGIRLPDDLLAKLTALNRSNFDNSYKGTAAFGRAIQDTRQSLNTQGIKLLPSYYSDTDATGPYKAYLKNLEDVKNQELKILTERGQQTLAILRNTATAEKAERDNAIKGWRDYIAALSAQGYKAVDGGSGYVRKTAVADVGQAQTLAINEQISRTLDTLRAKSIDTKLSADQLAASFRQNGIEISKLDDKQILALQTGVKKLGFDLKSTSGEFKEIVKQSNIWTKALGGITSRLIEFYSIRTVLFAVGASFREAVSDSLDFNQKIRDIIAISGTAGTEFENVSRTITDIARASRFTANEIADLMQVLAQAGVASEQLGNASRNVNIFASATATDPKLAADLFTTTMNVYGIKAENASKITNALTAALNKSKLEANGLATAFNYLAPQAAQFGYTMEETLGIIATMAQSGIKPSTIGTGVSQVLKEFAAPKDRLNRLFETYKIDPLDVNPMLVSFDQIVARLKEAKVQSNDLFRALESRVGRSIVTALNLGSEAFTSMTDSITGTVAATVAYDQAMQGARARMNIVKQEFLTLAVSVGSNLAPALSLGAEALQGFISVFNTDFGKIATTIGTIIVGFGGLIAFGKTVAAFFATELGVAIVSALGLASTSITAIIAGLAGVAAILTTIGVARNRSTKEQEKANQEVAKEYQANKDMLDILTRVKRAEEERNSGLKEYSRLIATGKEKEANTLGQHKVTITRENRKAIAELISNYPQYFKNLDKEIVTYKELTAAINERNKALGKGAVSAAEEYNRQVDKIANSKSGVFSGKTIAEEIQLLDRRVSEQRSFVANNPNNSAAQKQLSALLDRRKSVVDNYRAQLGAKDLQDLKSIAQAATLDGAEEFSLVDQFIADNVTLPKLKRTKIPKVEKDKDAATTKVDYGNRGGGIENQYNSSKVILENLRLEREEILTRVKTIYQTADELEAAFKRIEQIDKEYADASGEKAKQDVIANAKNIIKKEGQAKYDEYLRNAEELDNKKLAQLKAKQIKERQEIDKLQQQHELEIVRIEQDAQRKANEARIANLTKQITSAYTGDADRAKFVAQALGLTEANIDAEIDKQIAELTEKQRQAAERLDYTGIGRYQNQINNLNYDTRSSMKTEASKALNQQAVQGIQASEEKALQLEQQKLAVVEKQIAARKDSAWGADAVNALDIERLEAAKKAAQEERKIVLEKQKQIELAGELTNELADKYKTKLDGIAEKEKEITREIQKRNQGTLGNFVDGMQEAWNRISDVNTAAKELGSTLTNTFVNGLGTTLSNTFSTAFFPDQGKINEIQTKINELRTQKADLEANIGTIERNTDKTPEEIKNLNDYKTKLDEVNGALRQQEEAVRKQKDAWSTFAEGLKGIMKTILQELQNYIAKLFVVWAVQKLVGFIGGMFGGSTTGPGAEGVSGPMSSVNYVATGGLITKSGVRRYAEGGVVDGTVGGVVPFIKGTDPSKDSIPALLQSGEIVIKKSSVDYYGADKLLALNQKKIAKFAEGGLVGGGTPGNSSNSTGVNEKEIHVHLALTNIADVRTVPQPSADEIINVVAFNANAKKEMYRVIKNAVAN